MRRGIDGKPQYEESDIPNLLAGIRRDIQDLTSTLLFVAYNIGTEGEWENQQTFLSASGKFQRALKEAGQLVSEPEREEVR